MNRKLIRNSLSNAVYFSFISFVIIWFSGFLYTTLENTTGRLEMGTTIIITLGLILVTFSLAITNLLLMDPEPGHPRRRKKRVGLGQRLFAVLLFLILSAIILGVLSFLFWWQI